MIYWCDYTIETRKSLIPTASRLGGFIFNNGAADRTTTLIRNPRNHYCGADNGLITGNPNTWTVSPTLKSIYDPCPYGYRVPPSSTFSGFPYYIDPWPSGDLTGGWIGYSAWWPAAALRDAGSGSPGHVGVGGWFWTAKLKDAVNGLALSVHARGVMDNVDKGEFGFGLSLRCIPE